MIFADPTPNDIGDDFSYAQQLEHISDAELLVELKENVLQLLTRLEIEADPAKESANFTLDPQNHQLFIPESLRTELGDVQYSKVTFYTEVNYGIGLGSLHANLYGNLSTGKEVAVCVATNGKEVRVAFHIDDDDFDTPAIEPYTTADINRLIASVILPNKKGDYSFFDTLDLTDPKIIHNVAAALERHSDHSNRQGVYERDSLQLVYNKADGRSYEVAFDGTLSDGTPVTVATTHTDLTLEKLVENQYSIDGVEVYEKNGRELPQLNRDDLGELCVYLRNTAHDLNPDTTEIPVSPKDMDALIQEDGADTWHA